MHKQWTSLDKASLWLVGLAYCSTDLELAVELQKFQPAELLGQLATHVNQDGRTLLHVAAVRERMESLGVLLKNVTDVDSKDGSGKSSLYTCILHGSLSAAHLLVSYGADVSESISRLTGDTMLHRMVKAGQTKTVTFLLESGALINATTNEGDTPLHYSARYDRAGMAAMLLDAGCDIDAINTTGETAFHIAINNANMELAKFLIKRKADVSIKDKHGMTGLHTAVNNGSIELVRMMLSTNSSRINSKELLLGRTPLLLACSHGTNKMASLLLEHGADANLTTNYRKSVLHVAASSGNANVLKTVIKATSNLNTLAINNMTALHYAVCGGHTEIVKVLLRAGVSVNMKDIHGSNSLHMASSRGNAEIVMALLNYDAQINSTNMEQQTALHLALMNGHQEVGSLLVSAGCDINLIDVHDKTASDYFIQFGERQPEELSFEVVDNNHEDDEQRDNFVFKPDKGTSTENSGLHVRFSISEDDNNNSHNHSVEFSADSSDEYYVESNKTHWCSNLLTSGDELFTDNIDSNRLNQGNKSELNHAIDNIAETNWNFEQQPSQYFELENVQQEQTNSNEGKSKNKKSHSTKGRRYRKDTKTPMSSKRQSSKPTIKYDYRTSKGKDEKCSDSRTCERTKVSFLSTAKK